MNVEVEEVSTEEMQCIHLFPDAMSRGVTVMSIYAVNKGITLFLHVLTFARSQGNCGTQCHS